MAKKPMKFGVRKMFNSNNSFLTFHRYMKIKCD